MGTFLAKKMHYFMVTMAERNFGKAAEKLCITRSPLSKVICELEESLGGKLFKRTYSDLEPTELAMGYYYKCKNIYETLKDLESEMRTRTQEIPLKIIFDISIPELLYRLFVTGLSVDGLHFEHKRMIIDYEDLSVFLRESNNIVLSLRELNGSSFRDSVDKWSGDDIVLVLPDSWRGVSNYPPIFVWNDGTADYFKKGFAFLLGKDSSDVDFITHNYDLSQVLYNIHEGKGAMLMTRKMASLYKSDKVKIHNIEHGNLDIFLYYKKAEKKNDKINKIKSIINKFI
ncbi:TPA: LysR family transcriptional regulator [Salmonella enterica subsp. houtenae]|nr:LysR family transcriptional regulator [Salmonella enterica subsp. houtenae]